MTKKSAHMGLRIGQIFIFLPQVVQGSERLQLGSYLMKLNMRSQK